MLREIRLELDEIVEAPKRLAPLIDPNVHSCGTVEPHGFAELTQPERDFFIVGMKSYGRAPTFLLATGYEQVRSVSAWLAGDQADLTANATVAHHASDVAVRPMHEVSGQSGSPSGPVPVPSGTVSTAMSSSREPGPPETPTASTRPTPGA